MRRLIIPLGVACLAFTLLSACAPQAEQPAGPVVDEPTSTDADVEVIKAVNVQLINAFNAGDAQAAVALVVDDAADLPPNRPAIIGKEAIRASVESDMAAFTMHFVDDIVEVEVDGDLAVIWTNYTVTLTFKDGGAQITNNGKWIKVLKRQTDGSWKFSRNIWNSDNPAPPERPTT